jgi:DNA polymerase
MWLDTMSMFRAVFPDRRASLKVIAETLNIGTKGGESGYSVVNTRGIEDLSPQEFEACAAYCADDCDLAYKAWLMLKKGYSPFELRLIDQTIRFTTEPILRLNPEPLKAEIIAEKERKAELLRIAGEDQSVFASNPRFAMLLERLGVVPPVKISPTFLKKEAEKCKQVAEWMAMNEIEPNAQAYEEAGIKWAYAFGKTDQAMQAMLQHDDPLIVAAVEARIGVKSTISQTRATTFLDASTRGSLPIRLNYYAAHTGRWGGADGNYQNLPRGSRLRESIIAPEGKSLVVCDLSAIEARVLPYLAGQEDVVDVFRRGEDVYCDMASKVYQRPITKKDKTERQVGKLLVLSSGYGMGWKKFALNSYLVNKNLFGEDMLETLELDAGFIAAKHMAWAKASRPLTLTLEAWLAHCAVSEFLSRTYRQSNDKIVAWWAYCDAVLAHMIHGDTCPVDQKGIIVAKGNSIHSPIGNPIRYLDMQCEVDKKGRRKYSRASKEGRSSLHGGIIVENIVQWVSRHIMAEQALILQDEGLKIAFTCHDEIVGVCDDADAPYWKERMVEVMSTAPSWCPGLPLAAEASIGKNYSEAK